MTSNLSNWIPVHKLHWNNAKLHLTALILRDSEWKHIERTLTGKGSRAKMGQAVNMQKYYDYFEP